MLNTQHNRLYEDTQLHRQCAWCKKVHTSHGWGRVIDEAEIEKANLRGLVSHGICPACAEKQYALIALAVV